jgi:hypothetical protein
VEGTEFYTRTGFRQADLQKQKKFLETFEKIGKERKGRPGLCSVFITTLWPEASLANTIRINLGELGTEENAFSCQWSRFRFQSPPHCQLI